MQGVAEGVALTWRVPPALPQQRCVGFLGV